MPRWKASRLRHTDPMLLRPLSFAIKEDCEALRQVRAKALSIESAPVRSSWRSKMPSG